MVDVHTKQTRSKNMSAINSKNTKPELFVEVLLNELGYRFSRNYEQLIGKPDFVLLDMNCCIFVNGCYWHKHHNCHFYRPPKTRPEFWEKKLQQNKERDDKVYSSLIQMGWKVIVVWECAIKGRMRLDPDELQARLNLLINTPVEEERVMELR